MQKFYGVAYNGKYSSNEIENMISATDVRYWHCCATYEQPEEEDIDYNPQVDKEFDSAVTIFWVTFRGDEDEKGKQLYIDGILYDLMVPWYESIERLGWKLFDGVRYLEDLFESEEAAKNALEEWQLNLADNYAWRVVENGEARSWYQ